MRIGTLLKALRLAHFPRAPVRSFAHTVGIPERTVGAIEAGWRFPSLSTLTLYFQMQGPEGDDFRKAAQLASRIYREELVLRRLILDEPWFTAAHVLAKHVLQMVSRRLPGEKELTAALRGFLGPDSRLDLALAVPPEVCLITALEVLSKEPTANREESSTISGERVGRARAFYALFLRYLLTEIRFFGEADIKYEHIDSPFSEKQVETVRASDVADLPRILDSGMVPNAFSVLDLLILGGWTHVDFNLAIPGVISAIVVFDDTDTSKPNEVRFATRVISPEGQIVQPFARAPWRPSSNDFAVEVIAGGPVNRYQQQVEYQPPH